ncbi:MAG: LptF/LptG family permease, partial [Gammaproteobacteria bacterium]|nr:LptF/LptG family permease [Gammaproteobacteria bacterium]
SRVGRIASMGLRMLAGVMVGFGFYILNQFAGPMSTVLQFSPSIAAILPTLVFVCIGGVLCVKLSR